jgi:hypothetical protein
MRLRGCVNGLLWRESISVGGPQGSARMSLLRYDSQAMVPPRWPDEHGRLIPTYPCPHCVLEVASRFRGFRVENLKHMGWQLFRPASYVKLINSGRLLRGAGGAGDRLARPTAGPGSALHGRGQDAHDVVKERRHPESRPVRASGRHCQTDLFRGATANTQRP